MLIISYFFPPSGFVGGERVAAWAKDLSEYGYFPIVITRDWAGNKGRLKQWDGADIHYVDLGKSFKERLEGSVLLKPLRKLLTLFEIVGSNFSITFLHYQKMYAYAREIVKSDSEIQLLIVSGRPFESFSFGYKLHKEFGLKWMPDYRDEWTTNSILRSSDFLTRLFLKLNRRSEKKWTSNAAAFITVSEQLKRNIESLINKPGFVISNGFDGSLLNQELLPNPKKIVITYSGTLYNHQKIEPIFDVLRNLQGVSDFEFEFVLIGSINNKEQLTRINKLSEGLSNVKLLPLLSKEAHNNLIVTSDLLLLTAYDNIDHWLPAKLFEYYSSSIPILLYPTDNGAMRDFILDNKCGFIPNDKEECLRIILKCIEEKRMNRPGLKFSPSNEYSRKNQTKRLADIPNKIQ